MGPLPSALNPRAVARERGSAAIGGEYRPEMCCRQATPAVPPGYNRPLSELRAALVWVRFTPDARCVELVKRCLELLPDLPFSPLGRPSQPPACARHGFMACTAPERLKARDIETDLHSRAAHMQTHYHAPDPQLSSPHGEANSARIDPPPFFPAMPLSDVDRAGAVMTGLLERHHA